MVMGGMRSTLNRCQRFHDEMSITHGMTMVRRGRRGFGSREEGRGGAGGRRDKQTGGVMGKGLHS